MQVQRVDLELDRVEGDHELLGCVAPPELQLLPALGWWPWQQPDLLRAGLMSAALPNAARGPRGPRAQQRVKVCELLLQARNLLFLLRYATVGNAQALLQ
eukprot:1413207-Lingulodinium_polyedra.AAC.1